MTKFWIALSTTNKNRECVEPITIVVSTKKEDVEPFAKERNVYLFWVIREDNSIAEAVAEILDNMQGEEIMEYKV